MERLSVCWLIYFASGLTLLVAVPPYIPGTGLTDEIDGLTGENASYIYDQRLPYAPYGFQKLKNPNKCQETAAAPNLRCNWSSSYRTFDGTCNNPYHPFDGAVGECFLRLLPASYEGRSGFRQSKSGGPLPVPRDLTLSIFTDNYHPAEKNVSMMLTAFGQFVAHDVSLILNENVNGSCCKDVNGFHPSCVPLRFPANDPYYSKFNVTCLPFPRAVACASCGTGKREIFNNQTAAIDASITYGAYDQKARELRAFDGYGRLKTDNTSVGQLLPRGSSPDDQFCLPRLAPNCFTAGDARVNQHDILTSLHTVFMLEHNRIALALKALNPHWMEEKLYQEARRITIAEYQSITYNKYLPLLIGPEYMNRYDLSVKSGPRGTKYNPHLLLQTRNEFSGAIFRIHTMIASHVGVPKLRFKDIYISPEYIRDGMLHKFMSGSCKVASQMASHHMPPDTTNYLYLPVFQIFGQDLPSIDIQRGRDMGIPPYVNFIKYCTGYNKQIHSFDQLKGLINENHIELLKKHYKRVEDVDTWVGIQMETHATGSLLGPVSSCIIGEQFHKYKFADRFYWEHEGESSSFTPAQRMTLLNSSVSRLLCDNVPEIKRIAKEAMVLPSKQNPVVSCNEIPRVDLSLWKTRNSDWTREVVKEFLKEIL